MLDTAKVAEQLAAITTLTQAELEAYSGIIAAAAAAFDGSSDEQVNAQLALVAAARANYMIALAKEGEDNITSFKAGDISITESNNAVSAAQALMEELESTAVNATQNSGFVFQAV